MTNLFFSRTVSQKEYQEFYLYSNNIWVHFFFIFLFFFTNNQIYIHKHTIYLSSYFKFSEVIHPTNLLHWKSFIDKWLLWPKAINNRQLNRQVMKLFIFSDTLLQFKSIKFQYFHCTNKRISIQTLHIGFSHRLSIKWLSVLRTFLILQETNEASKGSDDCCCTALSAWSFWRRNMGCPYSKRCS